MNVLSIQIHAYECPLCFRVEWFGVVDANPMCYSHQEAGNIMFRTGSLPLTLLSERDTEGTE